MRPEVSEEGRSRRVLVEEFLHHGIKAARRDDVARKRRSRRGASAIGRQRIENRTRVDRHHGSVACRRSYLLRASCEMLGEVPGLFLRRPAFVKSGRTKLPHRRALIRVEPEKL